MTEGIAPVDVVEPPVPPPPPSSFARLRARGILTQSFLAMLVALIAVGLFIGRTHSPAAPIALIVVYAAVGLVLLFRLRRARISLPRLFGPAPNAATLPLILVAIPLLVLSIAGFWILFLPLSYVAPDFVLHWAVQNPAFHREHSFGAWLAFTIAACVMAPLVEELLFRGILLQRWAERWGTGTAVVASSALFAIGHVELIGHFIFGVAMAALYLRTRSLWLPIATHAANNLVASFMQLVDLLRHAPERPETLATLRGGWPGGVLTTMAGIALLVWYRRRIWGDVSVRATLTGPIPYDRPPVYNAE